MDQQMDGPMDEQTDGRTNGQTLLYKWEDASNKKTVPVCFLVMMDTYELNK